MIRVGFGYDAHPLKEGRPLILGGVDIPWTQGLDGHSDGDVMLHAIIDAILGAASLGDIGSHFPDTDPAYRGCSSLLLLSVIQEKISRLGYGVHHLDCTLVAQRPRIRPHVPEMRERISQALMIETDQVSVKATTTEQMGFTGREEGMACYAVCTLIKMTYDSDAQTSEEDTLS